jgi:hypothetical protein
LRRRQSGSSHFLERGAVEIGGVHPWAASKAKLDASEFTQCPLTKAEDNRRSDDDRAKKARHAAAFRAKADALEIEALANRRLADEYAAAQGRSEVGQPGTRTDLVPKKNGVRATTAADVGLSRKEIHKARQIRDAEKRDRRRSTERPRIAPWPFVPPIELLARCKHPLEFGRGVVLPRPYESLLMRPEVGDALPDFLAFGLHPIQR